MGNTPTKPVVSYREAIRGLKMTEKELRQMFNNHLTPPATGMSSELFMDTFGRDFSRFGVKVENRVQQVLRMDGGTILFKDFVIAMYLFSPKSNEEAKLKVIFNMFDVHGTGSIKKKDFMTMSMTIIKGDSAFPSFDSDFKALARVMSDAAMVMFDHNRDGKLSFEEWVEFALQDDAVQTFMEVMVEGQPKLVTGTSEAKSDPVTESSTQGVKVTS